MEIKIKEIVAESLTVDFSEVVLAARLADDLGADSLELVDTLMNVEDAFDIEISDEEAEKIVTVSDLIAVVKKERRKG